jgi:hypothetical protein
MAHTPFEPSIAGAQGPPPYDSPRVRVFGFPLLADAGPLVNLCNKFLNIAPTSAGISFEPILVSPNTCVVTIEALDYPSLMPTTAPWNDLGAIQQQEILFSVPVVRKQGATIVEAGIFIPYIFVTDQTSALAGREVLGLPKLLASFDLDSNFPKSGPIVVRFQGRKTIGGPLLRTALITVKAPAFAVPQSTVARRIGRFFGPLDTLFKSNPAFSLIESAVTTQSMVGFSTRVLIDPGNPSTDAYRSIARCIYTGTNQVANVLPSPMTITLSPFVHFDIKSTLGIRVNGSGNATSASPYTLDADFSLGSMTTLWES